MTRPSWPPYGGGWPRQRPNASGSPPPGGMTRTSRGDGDKGIRRLVEAEGSLPTTAEATTAAADKASTQPESRVQRRNISANRPFHEPQSPRLGQRRRANRPHVGRIFARLAHGVREPHAWRIGTTGSRRRRIRGRRADRWGERRPRRRGVNAGVVTSRPVKMQRLAASSRRIRPHAGGPCPTPRNAPTPRRPPQSGNRPARYRYATRWAALLATVARPLPTAGDRPLWPAAADVGGHLVLRLPGATMPSAITTSQLTATSA
jgi:hypothetical protein